MQASSIGIIGGADGPTAIYVAGKLSPIIIGLGAAVLIALGVWLFLKHK